VTLKQPSRDYLEVAAIIQQLLDGTGDKWAWDDFISKRWFKDPYLEQSPVAHPNALVWVIGCGSNRLP
jgi:hypothetical protein